MKKIKITFLGTSAMVPTVLRNHSSILFEYSPNVFLFDCGEGTQRQLRKIKFSANKIESIFLSHFHGDHILGLPGMLQTMNANDRKEILNIYGPKGLNRFMSNLITTFSIENLAYEVKLFEIENNNNNNNNNIIFENKDIVIKSFELSHTINCIGYKIIEKDRIKISNKKVSELGLESNPLLKK
ncbi:MAG: MBL fold metallo-hydrolase, partial [Candidatus Nanoarchaeia archaeon]|nr:MBL fold metallo-hydrolase [Candidatus Nanoarchaeia archaeon]